MSNNEKEFDAEHTRTLHDLNRHLFDGNADAIAASLADYIRQRRLFISEDALAFLLSAINDARKG